MNYQTLISPLLPRLGSIWVFDEFARFSFTYFPFLTNLMIFDFVLAKIAAAVWVLCR